MLPEHAVLEGSNNITTQSTMDLIGSVLHATHEGTSEVNASSEINITGEVLHPVYTGESSILATSEISVVGTIDHLINEALAELGIASELGITAEVVHAIIDAIATPDINGELSVEGEIEAGERSVIALALVPDRNIGRDLLLLDQPAEKAANPIGRIGHEALRLEIEALLRAINHDLGRFDLIVRASGCSLDVDNHCVLDVDQVVEAVAELHALVGLGSPGRRRV